MRSVVRIKDGFFGRAEGKFVCCEPHESNGRPEGRPGPIFSGGNVMERERNGISWQVVRALLIAVALCLGVVVPVSAELANIKLSEPLVVNGNVADWKISADSGRVVYLADADTDNVLELYTAPIVGGASVKLNGPLVALGNVSSFQISADSARVVYRADQDIVGVFELYSVSVQG
jgi:hypothetical protein